MTLWLLVLYLRFVSKRFFQNDFIMTEFKYNKVFKVGQFRCHFHQNYSIIFPTGNAHIRALNFALKNFKRFSKKNKVKIII